MYSVRHRHGGDSPTLDPAKFASVLREVRAADAEHPDVALSHESGWCLSYFHGGLMVFENVEQGAEVWHVRNVDEQRALSLWVELARGNIAAVKRSEHWLPGYR